ncbi:MAG: hypothetical protein H0T47_16245 [Planctomycetaceae bacterium]|nr:hypothetical protein [Planctomycetaceae bacterium]
MTRETAPLVGLKQALHAFATAAATQSQGHIRPLHQHLAQRLVIEGGFRPEDITPRPPLRIERGKRGSSYSLVFDAALANASEQTVLGGLKTKSVDVVVSKREIGPSLAISVKGTFNAFRNLTNRMEEAAGDCTNLHIAYPALVYGFLHVLRANRASDTSTRNDVAIEESGAVVDSIRRYHDAMARITNRSDIRNDVSRYEAVAIALVHPSGESIAEVVGDFPLSESPLAFARFFDDLYRAYDLRFVYTAPALEPITRRMIWSESSPVIESAIASGFLPRLGSDE